MHMSTIDRLPLTTGGSPLQIRCKDFRCVTFVIPRDRDCQDITESLQQLSQPSKALFRNTFFYVKRNRKRKKRDKSKQNTDNNPKPK